MKHILKGGDIVMGCILNDKDTEISLALRSINNLFMRATVQRAKKYGIDDFTLMHGWILSYLIKHKEENVYQRDIEKKFSITRSAVTAIVKNMEKFGYIKRVEVEHDARLKKIVITPVGEEMHKKMIENFAEMDKKMVENISEDDYETFMRVCTQIKNNLNSLL